MLVPAGKATDAVIEELAELFEKDDIIIDAWPSYGTWDETTGRCCCHLKIMT
jgi:6-phosphogluconate dehydrogenase (decarboxylating)